MLNPDKGGKYALAILISVVEYFLKFYFFPGLGQYSLLFHFFFILAAVGLGIRISAMYTAGSNFHHIIQTGNDPSHKLVVTGLYS